MFKSVRRSLRNQQYGSESSYSQTSKSSVENEMDDAGDFDINEDEDVDNYFFIISVQEILQEWQKYSMKKYKQNMLNSRKGKKGLKDIMGEGIKKQLDL